MAGARKILIVDDDRRFASGLKDVLDFEGCQTRAVNSGEEALEVFNRGSYDVVLMDIKMPVMNGVDVFKSLKRIDPAVAVIMMTAFSLEDLIEDAMREGVFGILHKPLDINKLMEMIESARSGGGLIMVADGEEDVRQSLKRTFEESGYSVSLATDIEEAVRITRDKPANIIFLDVLLPPLNGLESYLSIKEVNPAAVVVLMASYPKDAKRLAEQALQGNVYSCLYKPFDPREALEIVEEIMRKGR